MDSRPPVPLVRCDAQQSMDGGFSINVSDAYYAYLSKIATDHGKGMVYVFYLQVYKNVAVTAMDPHDRGC